LREIIRVAKRASLADLVLKGGTVANVFSGSSQVCDIAVYDGMIAGLGLDYHGKEEVNVKGKWVLPGLIDGHMHIESTMLLPSNLAAALLPHGTTAIVSDPHEIANVMGSEGIGLMIRDSESLPFDVFFMAPSCVPATPLETSGAALGPSELEQLKGQSRILGLAEVMNFPAVLSGASEILKKLEVFENGPIDGHCPFLSGYDLQAYVAAGIRSDHETVTLSEATEKLQSGMMIMVREGTSARNLLELLPLITERNSRRFCFVSDDLHPQDILERGHLDFIIKRAIQSGLDPLLAIQAATFNPAEYFGLKHRGAIAPGYIADLVVIDDPEHFQIEKVFKNGSPVVEDGKALAFLANDRLVFEKRPLNIASLAPESFRMPARGRTARIIQIVPGQILTHVSYGKIRSRDGWVIPDTEADVLKLAVIERHKGTGRIGLGLVSGFGLREGALASSVAHDSHNVVAVGVRDEDLFAVVKEVRDLGGGMAVALDEKILAQVPLEVGGLMTHEPLERLVQRLALLNGAAASLGCTLHEPFMTLSFLALPVIPQLKLTDMGLIDVCKFEQVPLFVEAESASGISVGSD
jgi:adenine deaminase